MVSRIQSALSSALSFTKGGLSTSSLSLVSLGVTTNIDGTLSLDTDALSSALSNRYSDAQTFFQQAGEFGQNFVSVLNTLGSTGNGTLALAKAANASTESDLANNKTKLEARLSDYETNLTAELNTANQILQAIPNQLKQVTALFDAINGTPH